MVGHVRQEEEAVSKNLPVGQQVVSPPEQVRHPLRSQVEQVEGQVWQEVPLKNRPAGQQVVPPAVEHVRQPRASQVPHEGSHAVQLPPL